MGTLSSYWPFFDLAVTTPRLTLQYVDDATAADLMELVAREGVHDPDLMPFAVPWTRAEPPVLQRNGLQYFWRSRADTCPEAWDLPLAVREDGQLVGVQALHAKEFHVTRVLSSGSWLVRSAQRRGIGKQMREAILQLAFEGLGAEAATTGAFADNVASLGVTRSLGYAENGWEVKNREGEPARSLMFLMERADWTAREDITISGLEPCLPLLGL